MATKLKIPENWLKLRMKSLPPDNFMEIYGSNIYIPEHIFLNVILSYSSDTCWIYRLAHAN